MKSIFYSCLSVLLVISTSCGKEDRPITELEEETITNLTLTFSPNDGNSVAIFSYEDLGAESGLPPTISSEFLSTNTTYEMKVELLTRKTNPIKILTGKIRDEGVDYQVFMQVSPDNVFQTFEYTDQDMNGQPIGLNSNMVTSERFTSGTLKVSLIKNPDKSVPYIVGENLPVGIGGEKIIEATFDVVIQ